MHTNLWKKTAALGLTAALLLSGCGGGKEKEPEPTPTPTPTPTPAAESKAPVDFSKYNAYLGLADALYEMEEVLEAYFASVNYAPEFALVEGGDYAAIKDTFQFYTPDTYPAREALEYVEEEPAYPAADEAVKNLGSSPADVMGALNHIASYVRFNEFEDDGMAKAPELHAELWTALETYDQYYGVFLTAMDDLAEQTQAEDLAQLLEEGEQILYYSRSLLETGSDILENIMDQLTMAAAVTDPGADFVPPVLDMTGLADLFAQVQTDYEGLSQALESQEEREKIQSFTGTAGDSSLKLYTSKATALYSAMGQLAEAAMAGTDYTAAFDAAADALNGMVDQYNRVI